MRVTHSIHKAAGYPRYGEILGTCRACGVADRGRRFGDWVKPTFTDHDKLLPGDIACNACLFCFDDQNGQLQQKLNAAKPQRFRNYSHFVDESGEWIPLSKGDKRRMAELIYTASVAVIALSGQKHLAFRCPPGWWQIEEHTVRPFPATLRELAAPVARLYEGGFSKAEIETGHYLQGRILAYGIEAWQKDEELIKRRRGTLALQLAVFLAQKENDETEETQTPED